MNKITLDKFKEERWNKGEGHPDTKPWFWVGSELYVREQWIEWFEDNCIGEIFISWDTANNRGRIWFENKDDAVQYRLYW